MTKNFYHHPSSIDIYSDERGTSELLETSSGKIIQSKGFHLDAAYDLACDHACKLINQGWVPKNEKIYIKEELRCDEEILNFDNSYPVCILSEFRSREGEISILLCRSFADVIVGLLPGFNRAALYARSHMSHKEYKIKVVRLAEAELYARTKNIKQRY